jgi:hypothetical protein
VGRGMGGLQKLITFFSGWAGLQKVDNRFGYEKWLQGGCKGWIHLYKRYV